MIQLTAQIIESFAGAYLSRRYDNARPTPQFHRIAWNLYCSPQKQVGCIAPRDHAKSTALTFDYIMAEVCFRTSDYVILIGSTEDKASEQLSNISEELHENLELRQDFGIKGFESDQKTEIIVICDDGHRFRIVARGAEQKIRGAMWNGKRPNLIVADDMEDDEQVENKDRRAKFRRWFFRAAKQALSKRGRIRVHGTILHDDSLLSRLRRNSMWKMLFFKAHKSYNDFSELLWPERWTEQDLRDRQKEFEEDNDAPGYSQEFLNTPLDNNESYLKLENFIAMNDEDYVAKKKYYCGADFAFSKNESANHTAFSIGGVCSRNLIHHVGQYRDKLDSLETVELFFEIANRWEIEEFFVPAGKDWLAIEPVVRREMMRRNEFLVITPLPDNKDKAAKGRVFQKKHRAQACRYDKNAEWYPGFEAELMLFTGVSDAKHDDQFDSTAALHRGIEGGTDIEDEDFETDEEIEARYESEMARGDTDARSCTGY